MISFAHTHAHKRIDGPPALMAVAAAAIVSRLICCTHGLADPRCRIANAAARQHGTSHRTESMPHLSETLPRQRSCLEVVMVPKPDGSGELVTS